MGQTERYLQTRLKEHGKIWNHLIYNMVTNKTSLVTQESATWMTLMKLEKLLDNKHKKWAIYEMVFINLKNTINKRIDIDNLNQWGQSNF